MIRFTPSQLAARCRSRGVAVDAVEAAVVRRDGDHVYLDDHHEAYQNIRLGLGDMVADGLASVGITRELVSRVLGKPCGCDKRQAALNKLGKRLGIG